MVASTAIFSSTGGTDGTPGLDDDSSLRSPVNIRFKTADDPTIDTVNPIPIPGTGTNRSFWKSLFLKVTGGSFTQINNIQFFTDGTGFGTGILVNVGDQLPIKNAAASTGYNLATGIVGTDGDEMNITTNPTTGYTGITSVTDAFSFTSGSPFAPGDSLTISESGNIIDAVGETSNYYVFQMEVVPAASPGDLPDETWTWQYDEI